MQPHILFVCGRNRLRSPTAAKVYQRDPRISVRSAGLSPGSPHTISAKDIDWADLILVMDAEYAAWIRDSFRDLRLPPIHSLDIPDEYGYMDPELVELIRAASEPYLRDLADISPEASGRQRSR